MNNDTPRTEEALIDNADLYDQGYGKSNWVSSDFARTLERELNSAQADIIDLISTLEAIAVESDSRTAQSWAKIALNRYEKSRS